MSDNDPVDFLTAFSGVSEPGDLEGILRAKLQDFGFSSYSYIGFGVPMKEESLFVACNYPEPWITHYTDAKYVFADPMLTTAMRSRLPFNWQSLHRPGRLNRGQKRILGEGSEFGIKEGLTIPIHGPGGEFAQLSIVCDAGKRELDHVWQHKAATLHMLGVYYHAALWGQALKAEVDTTVALSPREAEILTWTARGKSAWEISEILAVTERTVLTHLQRTYQKLGTYGKAHTIAKACIHGIIRP